MSGAKNKPVAVVSREDFERMKRKSARRVVEPVVVVEGIKKNQPPVVAPAPRKALPKSLELTEQDKDILTRADIARQEELAEIRRANRIILTAKCNLIRNAQIAEKAELKRERSQQDAYYDELMEKDRQEEFKRVALENEEREKLNKQNAEMLQNQLERRAIERQKQADRIRAEAEYLARMEAKLKESKEQTTKLKEMRREKLKKDFQQTYEMNQKIKSSNFEKERLSELKIQEYMRQKKNREEAQDAERRLRNDLRERKMLKMCEDQMQTRTSQNEKYEKWFKRESERKEREFRRKELEAAIKRKEFEAAILEDRKMQQREKKRLQDQEDQRQLKEYEENLRLHQEAVERDKLSDCSKQKQREYCELIKEQMRIKEQQRQMERRKSQADLEELRAREQERQSKIGRVLSEKIKELRMSHVPDNLIKDVERRIKRVTTSS